MSTRLARRNVPKAANYTLVYPMDAPGTTFTNRGATGTVTFTLPKPTRALLGVWYDFLGVADFTITVAAPAAGQLLGLNNAAGLSLSASTSAMKIGARINVECTESTPDVFVWAAMGVTVGVTYTLA